MPLPQRLWHYTTQDGLLGIIKSRELWATDVLYLNDASEFTYAVELAKTVLEDFAADARDFLLTALEPLKAGLGWQLSFRYCVASFSENQDLLSQWRAYGGIGGFSLAFDSDLLPRLAPSLQLRLEPCIYDRDEQLSRVRSLLNDVMALPDDTDDALRKRRHRCTRRLASLAPTLKHPAFQEEGEWRLITRLIASDDPTTRFRSGRSMLVPYVPIPLSEHESERLPVRCVQQGPTPHEDLAWLATQHFLSTRILGAGDIAPIYVWPASIPFRSW